MATFLKVVKAGDPEPDSEILAVKKAAAEQLLASGDTPFMLYLEGEPITVSYAGDAVAVFATAEEVCRDCKRQVLGMGE